VFFAASHPFHILFKPKMDQGFFDPESEKIRLTFAYYTAAKVLCSRIAQGQLDRKSAYIVSARVVGFLWRS
jgi:hypothetical protein